MRLDSLLLLFSYRLLTSITILPVAGYLVWHRRHDPPYGKGFWQLMGLNLPPKQDGVCVIFHAASMGEANAIKPLVEAFIQAHPQIRTVITTLTTTGASVASKIKGAEICFAPLDQHCAVKKFFKRLKPSLLITGDTELWPEKLLLAQQNNCKSILVSARMQEKNVYAYLRYEHAVHDLMTSKLVKVMCASLDDAARYRKIGVPSEKILVTGNLKYDIKEDTLHFKLGKKVKANFKGPVLGAISTHAGEEQLILKAYLVLAKQIPNLSLVLVPRHQDGVKLSCSFLEAQKISYQRKSTLVKLEDCTKGILIGDTMGEIALYFGMIDLAFMGGSFVSIGGHNPLEPACYGIPSITGPDFHNFKNEFLGLCDVNAAFIVKDQQELIALCQKLLTSLQDCLDAGIKAKNFLQGGRGAVKSTLIELEKFLPPISPKLIEK